MSSLRPASPSAHSSSACSSSARSSTAPGSRLARLRARAGRWAPTLLVLLALTGMTLGTVACATNPATGERQLSLYSTEQEVAIGQQNHQQILATLGEYPDQELQAYVQRLGADLADASERPDLPWTFTVVDDPTVNAFALPGGYIYITRGILTHMSSEAELVAVLGHEIGHVTARHSVSQMSRSQLMGLGLMAGMILSPELQQFGNLAQAGLSLLLLQHSRDDERQADDLGLRYMNNADYDPTEMMEVFRVLDRVSQAQGGSGRIPVWLATHPNPANRVARIGQAVQAAPQGTLGSRVGRDDLLRQVDGVVFGDDPREGYFLGRTFYHPDLAFQLSFPAGWSTRNQKQAVTAVSPDEDAVVLLTLANAASPQEAAQKFFSAQGIQPGNQWRNQLGGMPAQSGYFRVQQAQGQPNLAGLVAFVEQGDRVYQLLGYTTEPRLSRHADTFQGSLASFERLSDRRYRDVEPKRVEMVRLPSAMGLEEFDRRYPSAVDLGTLAIINSIEPGEQLQAGQRYKRVLEGRLPSR